MAEASQPTPAVTTPPTAEATTAVLEQVLDVSSVRVLLCINNHSLTHSLTHAQIQLSKTKQELKEMCEILEQTQNSFAAAQVAYAASTTELDTLKSTHAAACKAQEDAHKKEMATLQARIKALSEQHEHAVEDHAKALADLKTAHDKTSAELVATKTTADEGKKANVELDKQLTKAKSEVESMKQQLAGTEATNKALSDTLRTYENNIQTLNAKAVELQASIKTLAAEKEVLSSEKARMADDAKHTHANLTSAVEVSLTLESRITALNATISNLQAELQQASMEIQRLKSENAIISCLQQRIDDLTRTVADRERVAAEFASMIHRPGMYSTDEPALPAQYVDHYSTLLAKLRVFAGFVVGSKLNGAFIEQEVAPEISRVLIDGADAATFGLDTKTFARAMLIAACSKALFNHFTSPTFDDATIPLTRYGAAYKDRLAMRRAFAKQFDQIRSTSASDLFANSTPFSHWVDSVKGQLQQITGVTDAEQFDQVILGVGTDPRVQLRFWEVCQLVWALHKLSRAFAIEPEMIRPAPGDAVDASCCKSHYLYDPEDLDKQAPDYATLSVACVLLPGFELDGHVMPCDVLWA